MDIAMRSKSVTKTISLLCRKAVAFMTSAALLIGAGEGVVIAHAEGIPAGAFNPDSYQGTTYTVHGKYGTYQTGEIKKVYTNAFYYKDEIVVEDSQTNVHQSDGIYNFNLVTYDKTILSSKGFASLKTLQEKGIVEITDGITLGTTVGDKYNGQTTIQRIRFINPNYIVRLYGGSVSTSGSPESQNKYNGIISCIEYVGVYATTCNITYAYEGNESEFLWQNGTKSSLPTAFYAAPPVGSYTLTFPLPAVSGRLTDCIFTYNSDIDSMDSFGRLFQVESTDDFSYTQSKYNISLKGFVYGNNVDGSKYTNGNIEILGQNATVTFESFNDGPTVTFNSNGGAIPGCADGHTEYVVAVPSRTDFSPAELAALVSEPTRSGYAFEGWVFKKDNGVPFDYEEEKDVGGGYYQAASYRFIRNNNDFYALWTKEAAADGSSDGKPAANGSELKDPSGNDTGYKVTGDNKDNPTVVYEGTEADKSKDTIVIPATVKDASGNEYKVTEIKADAFKGNTKVKSVTVGDNVENIGDGAFDGCTNLKTVKIGKNVKRIGRRAFRKCKKLSKATIPASVEEIGANAFDGAEKLSKLTINCKNLKKIGKNAVRKIKPSATIKLKGSKKNKKAVANKLTKKKTGYKNTMKIKM